MFRQIARVLAGGTVWAVAVFGEPAPSTRPAAPPRDTTLEWLVGQSTDAKADKSAARQPTSQPGTQPAAPFQAADADPNVRAAVLATSDGESIRGRFATTPGKPVRVWDEQQKTYRDIPFAMIASIEARIVWEREEREWHFKQSGSDLKEYSGKTYPAREMVYVFTLVNGQQITGGTVAPLYLEMPRGNDKTFVLHKRDKGEIGQTLKDLVYVKRVEFDHAK